MVTNAVILFFAWTNAVGDLQWTTVRETAPDTHATSAVMPVATKPAPTAAVLVVAERYKSTLEGIYGVGAVTNTALTKEVVAVDISLREDVTADTALRLSTWFEILVAYTGTGEVWSFPWYLISP